MLRLKGTLVALLEELRKLWQAGKPDLSKRRKKFVWSIRIRKALGFKKKGRQA